MKVDQKAEQALQDPSEILEAGNKWCYKYQFFTQEECQQK